MAKFCNDWVKIVDFLIKAYFWESLHWPYSQCIFTLVNLVSVLTEA